MTLGPIPGRYVETRGPLHQLAFFALGPARYKAVGRMGLRATPGGFGTPEFEGRVARIDGDALVHEQGGNVATQRITTIRAAAEFFGHEYEVDWFEGFHDPLQPADPDTPLIVDDTSARAIGDWFEFAFDVLNRLRGHGTHDDQDSEVQLWPEHFDPATEIGNEAMGQRASFGASPGDAGHLEPYLYVAAWGEVDHSHSYWNGQGFNGASLGYATLLVADDPGRTALDFLLEGCRILHGG